MNSHYAKLVCQICDREFDNQAFLTHQADILSVRDETGKPHIVGEINTFKSMYISKRIPKVHFFRIGLGYPISVKVLEVLKQRHIENILIIEEDRERKPERKYYTAKVSDYDMMPVFQENKKESRSPTDAQKCFPLLEMRELQLA